MASDTEIPHEIVGVNYRHDYRLNLKTATWATALIVVGMAALYGILGLPPTLEGYYSKMYIHSIVIGLAALASYMVISVFGLQKAEPPIDFPIHYRAFFATVFAAAGGIIYLSPSFDLLVPDLGLGLFIVAFILIGDVGGAVFIQLMLYPRKVAGTYSEETNYLARMFPTKRKDFDAYAKAGVTYWLAVAAVGSAFIGGMIGFANLWVRIFGPSVLSGFISWLGLDGPGFLANTFDPHTHDIVLAVMAGVVAVVAHQFRAFDLSGIKKSVARAGLWISVAGVVAMTIVYLGIAFAGFSPPSLFPSPDGVNGIAGDDAAMSVIGAGATIALFPLLLTRLSNGRPTWRDPLRMALLGTWVGALLVNVGEAFYIEMNESSFQSTLLANDNIFGQVQTMYGLFTLTGVALILSAADYYRVSGRTRMAVGWLSIVGLVASFTGAALRTFVDPTRSWIPFGARVYTVLFLGTCALIAIEAIRRTGIIAIGAGAPEVPPISVNVDSETPSADRASTS